MWVNGGNGSRKAQAPYLNRLTTCMDKAVTDGYKECFKVTARGLYAISQSRYYRPEQVQVVETCRFEGANASGEKASMYVIETSDGLKGTLIDGYGAPSDIYVSKFISEVEDIRRKVARHNKHEC
jgi:hypothetical protein